MGEGRLACCLTDAVMKYELEGGGKWGPQTSCGAVLVPGNPWLVPAGAGVSLATASPNTAPAAPAAPAPRWGGVASHRTPYGLSSTISCNEYGQALASMHAASIVRSGLPLTCFRTCWCCGLWVLHCCCRRPHPARQRQHRAAPGFGALLGGGGTVQDPAQHQHQLQHTPRCVGGMAGRQNASACRLADSLGQCSYSATHSLPSTAQSQSADAML